MALIHGRLEIVIFTCRFLSCELLGGWRHFLSVRRSGLLFRSRLRFDAIRPVEAGMASVHLFFYHRAIDVGVVNDGSVHARHGGVITERVSFPSAAPVTIAGVAVAVVDASVKTDSRTPVALIKSINAVVPAPPGRRPKKTDRRRRAHDAGDPIII